MKDNQRLREYKIPLFQLVRQDKSNKVFFAASGTPGGPIPTSGINPMTRNSGSDW